jgi:hypothetical protein
MSSTSTPRDLVSRLRSKAEAKHADCDPHTADLLDEAANALERVSEKVLSDTAGAGLIERLRETSEDWPAALVKLEHEAADHIERLERENLELRHDLDRAMANHNADLNEPSSAKEPITPDALECLRRLIAKHTGEQLPSITPERVIEIVRAGMRAVKV